MLIERKQNHMLRITAVSFNLSLHKYPNILLCCSFLSLANIQCVLIFTLAVIHSS